MSPIAKENELLTATPEAAARTASPAALSGESAVKQQPVALEVAVTVNGARAVDGSDKREPFSESTKTVLVFGNGAVIRLSSSVAPGQLLFLTNEKTKKEVVCQVVKSKNYRNVSGYVELEFTEPVVGFWGMRFPSDRIGSGPQQATPAPAVFGSPAANGTPVMPRPVVPKVEAPAASLTSEVPVNKITAAPKPEAPVVKKPVTPVIPIAPAAPVKPIAPASSAFDLPRAPEAKASIFAPPPQTPATPLINEALSFSSVSGVKSAASSVVNAPQSFVASDSETEALKQHTARLQEQLSTLLFTVAASSKPLQQVPVTPAMESAKLLDSATKVLEIAKREPAPVKPAEPAKVTPAPLNSPFAEEEMKIPAWLEPLARNAAAPASTQELIEREKAKRLAEQAKIEETAEEPVAAAEEENVFELQAPTFGSVLPIDEIESVGETDSRSSGKGILIGAIAAGVLLLVAGGWWYMRQQSSGVQASTPAATQTRAVSVPAADTLHPQGNAAGPSNPSLQTSATPQSNLPVQTSAARLTYSALNSGSAAPASISSAPVPSAQLVSNPANNGAAVATSASVQPEPEQPKKTILGEVHLATPKVTKSRKPQDDGAVDAGIAMSEAQPESNGETLGAGLTAGNQQPAAPVAPLPIGGDVKQARLLSSIPPVYPTLAKNQHVSGDVRIDALIDANGRVTTMKVVSGPTLLHQSAMDALRQWKYQPALLDGKPAPMHLTVTIQFRLQ
jgi:periplasmic protein TonB